VVYPQKHTNFIASPIVPLIMVTYIKNLIHLSLGKRQKMPKMNLMTPPDYHAHDILTSDQVSASNYKSFSAQLLYTTKNKLKASPGDTRRQPSGSHWETVLQYEP
jgi:hypothetical protein